MFAMQMLYCSSYFTSPHFVLKMGITGWDVTPLQKQGKPKAGDVVKW
jgi:hypothetical protein